MVLVLSGLVKTRLSNWARKFWSSFDQILMVFQENLHLCQNEPTCNINCYCKAKNCLSFELLLKVLAWLYVEKWAKTSDQKNCQLIFLPVRVRQNWPFSSNLPSTWLLTIASPELIRFEQNKHHSIGLH